MMTFSLCYCGGTGDPADTTTADPGSTPEQTTTDTPTSGPETITAYYDDYTTEYGSISSTADGVKVEGDALELIEVGGEMMFHAKGVGTATVSDGTNTCTVTVEKAKLNVIVIMGQSNSGNHFANATSDVRCPKGTAYWWGNGNGTKATEPVDFIYSTKGFHAPLLAELYAQSVKNGTPEKNVLVWHEGGSSTGNGTSKNGSSITGWASSETNTSGTDYTVEMVNKCVEYYEGQSDKYEIISKGVYWLQGEGDGNGGIDPVRYTKLFEAIWNRLKTDAGLEYMAIMRVRRGGDNNTLNNDIHYSSTSSSQYALANKHDDIFMATTITENFTGAPTTEVSIDIKKYVTLMEEYGKEPTFSDTYGNTATFKNGILTTPMKTLFGSNNKNHYGKFGYALIGADAAYNMYNALHGKSATITQATSSGKPSEQTVSKNGSTVDLDITELASDLSFYATCGSVPGKLTFKITSGDKDITNESGVIIDTGANYGCISSKALKTYDSVKIVVTYTPVSGSAVTVTYNVIGKGLDLSDTLSPSYIWEFEGDLYARDSAGNKVNAFMEKALNGSYKIENGMLKLTKGQLEIARVIELANDKNWSVEIKFGDMSGANGFILASKIDNVVGNKAFSYRGGKLNVSNYAEGSLGKGYYNYASPEAAITSGCVMRIVNTYDATTKQSTLSLYKDGVLVVADIQKGTGDYNGGSAGVDMSAHALDGAFDLAYLGCSNSSGSFLLTMQIDYIKIDTGN